MTHRAGDQFFDQKRLWSLRKDEILGCYLAAYLPEIILETTNIPMTRKLLIAKVIKGNFCEFHRTAIRNCIKTLLQSNQLISETGKTRINDDVKIWTAS